MIDARDRLHPHRGGRRRDRRRPADRRRRPGDQRALVHAERRRRSPATATSTSPTCTTTGFARSTRETAHHHRLWPATASFGNAGDDGPATDGEPGRPGGHRARRRTPRGGVTIFIADYCNGAGARRRSRRHHPQRHRRRARRVRRAVARRVRTRRANWLYVADSSNDQVVAHQHPARRRAEPRLAGRARSPALKKGAVTAAEERRRPADPEAARSGGRCRSCARTAAAWRCSPCCCCSRSVSARCSRGRSKIVIDYVLQGLPTPRAVRRLARRPIDAAAAGSACSSPSSSPASCAGRQAVRVGVQHAGAGRHRPADGLRPSLPAVRAPAGARLITTSRPARATRSTGSTSTRTRSKTC